MEAAPHAGASGQPQPPVSCPAKLTASVSGVMRHPGLGSARDSSNRLSGAGHHQGRRAPPPGWVATDISGRLCTSTAVGEAPDGSAGCDGPGGSAYAMARRGPQQHRRERLAAALRRPEPPRQHPVRRQPLAAEPVGAPQRPTDFSERTPYGVAAGLSSERRRQSVTGWPDGRSSEPSGLGARVPAAQPAQPARPSTAPPSPDQAQQEAAAAPAVRWRHPGFYMSPSGYCRNQIALDFFQLSEKCLR